MGGGVSGAVGDVFPKMEKARGVKISARLTIAAPILYNTIPLKLMQEFREAT